MITVSIKNLAEAIQEAEVYSLPEMNDGENYLYHNVYRRMSRGDDIRLSEIDFHAFESEDIESFGELYSDVFERNCCAADNIASTLQKIAPASKAVAYV